MSPPFSKLIIDAGYKFTSASRGRAVITSRQQSAVELMEYLRDVYRLHNTINLIHNWLNYVHLSFNLFRLRYVKRKNGTLVETNRQFFYMDETWVNRYHKRKFTWKRVEEMGTYADPDGKINRLPPAYVGDMDLPDGKGERLIIIHYMSKNGLLKGAEKVFIGKKKAEDYHEEMNGIHFEEHLRDVVLKLLPRDCVLVVDKARYHNRYTEDTKKPTGNKQQIVEWLKDKELPPDFPDKDDLMSYTNNELLSFCGRLRVKPRFRIDDICATKGITVLRTPTKHCELNPIELLWADVKGKVAQRNVCTQSLTKLRDMVLKIFDEVEPAFCQKIVDHVHRIERGRYKAEMIMDTVVEPVVVTVGGPDSEDVRIPLYISSLLYNSLFSIGNSYSNI